MPLIAGKSNKAFKKNVETEMEAGKPQKQSLAIAYSMKRKAKRMADGGFLDKVGSALDNAIGNNQATQNKNYQANNPYKKAHGGFIDDETSSGYLTLPNEPGKRNSMAMLEDERKLNQHGQMEEGPQMGGEGFHEESYMQPDHSNGESGHQTWDDDMDMVGRIMKQRQMMYSKGGQVANQEHGENNNEMAGFSPNEFDDLVLRDDDLEGADYTGANSGDELGNAREDHDRQDIISKIMRSRAKKDRLPNPR